MSAAPKLRDLYTVSWGYYGECAVGFRTWPEVIAKVKELRAARQDYSVVGDGYDCDCDQDGYYCISSGLTEDEEDELREINEQ